MSKFGFASVEDEEKGDDEFASITGPPISESAVNTMTLEDIQAELEELTEQANKGLTFNEKRMDLLLEAQEENEEYQATVAEENQEWRQSVDEFTFQCLERMRTFIPVNIFSSSHDDLGKIGLSGEISKRILQKQCLWLCRMGAAEIARLHESDLYGRYNSTGQGLDIIETAAIHASLPTVFNNDASGKKQAWRTDIEENLKQMLLDNDNDVLPMGKIRSPTYGGLQYGPVKDTTSVRKNIAVSSEGSDQPRTSFEDVCKGSSVLKAVLENPDDIPSGTNNST